MSKITRRETLARGGAAVAAAAVLPLLSGSPTLAGEIDAGLIALDRQHVGMMAELKRNADQRRSILDTIPEEMKREIESYTDLYYANGEPVIIAHMHDAWRGLPQPLLKRYERALDERGMPQLEQQEDEILARVKATETKIDKTPANSFEGLAIKLRDNLASRENFLHTFNLQSALRDAERLAGRAAI